MHKKKSINENIFTRKTQPEPAIKTLCPKDYSCEALRNIINRVGYNSEHFKMGFPASFPAL